MADSRSLLRMEQILGKGRGLAASQPLKASQILSFSSSLCTLFFTFHLLPPFTPDDPILEVANFLHSLISPLFPPQAQLYVDLIAQLLAKDRLNSFCLMDPYFPDGPQRSIKAYAI
ncbi:hypothetical protein JHK82_025785 [Glycine max]|nr:hypothetical protein JHK85_026400 [Glycine max]KAG5134597.1 hypothetical protein JHK82_025785 [Glycine max]